MNKRIALKVCKRSKSKGWYNLKLHKSVCKQMDKLSKRLTSEEFKKMTKPILNEEERVRVFNPELLEVK